MGANDANVIAEGLKQVPNDSEREAKDGYSGGDEDGGPGRNQAKISEKKASRKDAKAEEEQQKSAQEYKTVSQSKTTPTQNEQSTPVHVLNKEIGGDHNVSASKGKANTGTSSNSYG